MTRQNSQEEHQTIFGKNYLFPRYYTLTLWLALVLLVLSIGVLQDQKTGKGSPAHPGSLEKPISPTFILTGRYTLGLKTSGFLPRGVLTEEDFRPLIFQMENLAGSPGERICLAPLIAELIGTDSALAYLDRLKQDFAVSPATMENLILFSRIYSDGASSLSKKEQQELLDDYGWFSQVALSHGLPETDTIRAEILNESRRILLSSLLFITAGTLLASAGLILSLIAVTAIVRKRLRFAFLNEVMRDDRTALPLLETMVLYLLFMASSNILSGSSPRMVLWLISVPFVISILFWPRLRGMSLVQLKTALGWHHGKGIVRETCSGIVGYLAGLPVIIGGIFLSMQMITFTKQYPVHPIVPEMQHIKGFEVLWIYALACLFAPVIEESLFRGALYWSMRARYSIAFSAFANGLLFAAIHPQGIAAIPALAAIGMVFCLIREWRDSLIAPITAHALNNFIVTSMLYIMF